VSIGKKANRSLLTVEPAIWAFAELEIAYTEHGGAMFWLHDPVWDPIRNDPRFKDLRRRVNLPPE
jgi:hypothetical protein